ncbi:TonB-dependent receptor [uncultured Bacteroides sp.]|uniref:TonB-dependent receptor n=1 Tax=uncultured Bacteroides sp. TaxID=162156 RepID=UPI002AAC2A89|nr:TonB-dependent receptor [uncultured Bacteroides sp.]
MYKSALLFSLFLLSQYAQSSPIDNDTLSKPHVVLDEVVVTSYKEKKNIREIPASVSLIPLSEIRNKNILGMKDISSAIPNLFIPDYGSKLTSPIYIRGIGSKINVPSVGLYVDGVPFFDKSVFDFDINEVDRIEVLRGPQGTLYGRNTMGGIINVYTKNPLAYNGGTLSATVANYGQTQFSGSYYGKLSDSFGYSLSGNYKHSDGFFKNDYTGSEADNLNAASGKLKLYWRKSARFNANLLVNYENSDQGGYPYALIDKTTGKIGNVNYNDYSSYRRGVLTSGLTMNYSFDHFLLKSVTGYQYFDDRQAIDQDFTPKEVYFVTQKQRQHMISQELEMRSLGDKRYSWLNGFFAFHQGTTNTINVKSAAPTVKDYDAPTDGFAFYHQSTLKDLLFKKLSATVGVRFDYEKAKQDYNYAKIVSGAIQPVQALNTNLEFTQLTPKFSLQYQFTPVNMTYATVTRGYKTGGFNTSFDVAEDQTFKPEYSWNYEVGGKFSCFGDRLKGDLSLFYIDWDNQQISQPVTSAGKVVGSMLRNAGKSYSKGAELTMQGRIYKGLNLQMSYGYTEAKFRSYQYGSADYSGNFIPYIPGQTLMLGGDYTLNLHSKYVDRVVFSTQYIGTGKLYWNETNAASQGYYGILNGKVSAHKGNLTVDLWTKNATSQKYTAFYFEMTGNSFGQKGRPMTFGTTLTFTL